MVIGSGRLKEMGGSMDTEAGSMEFYTTHKTTSDIAADMACVIYQFAVVGFIIGGNGEAAIACAILAAVMRL